MVLLTFVTKDMRRLRVIGILSNIAFIGYGALCWLPPVLCLHLVLLPVNVVRLMELHKTSATTITMNVDKRARTAAYRNLRRSRPVEARR